VKSFQSLQVELDENFVRAGAVAAYGMKSRREGDAAVQAYKIAKQRLRDGGRDVSVEQRLARIEAALDALLDGLVKQRAQIGSGVAVDVAGHTLTAKTRSRR
jgi:hypothetical protein